MYNKSLCLSYGGALRPGDDDAHFPNVRPLINPQNGFVGRFNGNDIEPIFFVLLDCLVGRTAG